MNAADLERLRAERAHAPQAVNCARSTICWCGLCHCERCQFHRAALWLADREKPETEREP